MTDRQIDEMNVSGVQHLIERAYRESGELQYIRELYKNAEEAGATRIEFQPEWQAVERLGVYRLAVVDNGRGMKPDDLRTYMNTFGGGGKPIGEAHENYGIGSKTSTLPWNKQGIVVISYTEEAPEGAMIWLCHDEATGSYGARKFELDDGSFDSVIAPFDDPESEIDWRDVKPDWLDCHGTIVVLLGNTGREDTFMSKQGDALDVKVVSAYLNRRMWDLPDDVEVYVQEMRSSDRDKWPRSFAEATGPADDDLDRRYNRRRVRGARYYVENVTGASGNLAHQGVVPLSDGTEIRWYLWEGERPMVQSYAHRPGYIGALYKDELYDIKTHHASFRRFGINQSAIRRNLTLIAVPPALEDGFGVYPDTARNSLRIKGTGQAGAGLPWDEWGEEFAKNLPQPLIDALRASVESEVATLTDEKWGKRLAERFSARWKRWVRKITSSGSTTTTPSEGGRPGGNRPTRPGGGSSGGSGGRSGGSAQGHGDGDRPARRTQVAGGVPDYQWVSAEEIGEADVAAVWNPPSALNPNGLVQMNREFQPMVAVVEHWQEAYPEHMALKVQKVIEEVYGQAMSARIAHSESLKRVASWGATRVEDELRSPGALTMAVLGLVSEDAIIAQRLGGLLGSPSRQDD